jgi:hypothetical protein
MICSQTGGCGTGVAHKGQDMCRKGDREEEMDLNTWLPGLFLLGLAVMGAMYLFVRACEKV